jgi:hypothetical protein
MVPEISHRCPSCGVSVRERDALFCPECGNALKDTAAAPVSTEANRIVENPLPAAASSEPPTVSTPPQIETTQVEPSQAETTPSVHPHRIAEKTRETLHRASAVASAAARGVIEEPVKRVEKIRHASSHVIEEASYDPSLRFVLVAVALFVVFVILLVLSKVMG